MKLIELLQLKNIWFEKDGNRLLVFDDAYLNNTQLKEFPSCPIVFFGDVNLSDTQIEEFPNFPISFCGSLILSDTKIKELPDSIICYFLSINGTSISKIPKKLVAACIYTPTEGELDIHIKKNGKIGINSKEKSIAEWEVFFKERKPFDESFYCIELSPQSYDIVEQDFKTAVELLKTWNS